MVRVLGLNPGPLSRSYPRIFTRFIPCNSGPKTLQGTNTYLVGTGSSRILIDSGEGKEGYLNSLVSAMVQTGAQSISAILITHWHSDHTGGVPALLQHFGKDIPVWQYPFPLDAKDEDAEVVKSNRSDNKIPYSPRPITDAMKFATDGASLVALHTPGHTADHVAFLLEEEKAVFSGDCVLGQGTTLFADLYTYMASLEKLRSLDPTLMFVHA